METAAPTPAELQAILGYRQGMPPHRKDAAGFIEAGAYLLNVQTNGVSMLFPDHEVLGMTKTGEEDEKENGFDGPWWRYPPLRNALLAGLIAGAGFVLAHFGLIAETRRERLLLDRDSARRLALDARRDREAYRRERRSASRS